MNIGVILAAGGLSERYGVRNKLFEAAGTSKVIIEAIKPFLAREDVTRVLVGIHPSFSDEFLVALDNARISDDRIVLVRGGATRTETVKNAVFALPDDIDIALIHDAARPYVTPKLIDSVLEKVMAEGADAALPLLKPVDSLVRIANGVTPVDRAEFALVQTPVAAKRDILQLAYKNAQSAFYDDISVIKTLDNVKIASVDGDPKNIKITVFGDLEQPLAGVGYDIHRLENGDGITLCGVRVPCEFSFVAHSDGDVPVHALMDAILTAIGEADIGHFFPVDDPRYDGANSMELLATVLDLAKSKGKKPLNASICVIAERPYLSPYIPAMKKSLAAALGIDPCRVGVSATTNEQCGEIGAKAAIASFATVLLGNVN